MKKWPKSWIEHINKTCSFYFENKDINFIDSRTLYVGSSGKMTVSSIRLTFQKHNKLYDIYIKHEDACFIIDYYHKNYYMFRKRKKNEQDLISLIETWLGGNDKTGLFNYFDLGGDSSQDFMCSAYEISKSIEIAIDSHIDRRDDGDDDDGENDPVEPLSPVDEVEPELICS